MIIFTVKKLLEKKITSTKSHEKIIIY
jgi:hypothetical protein